MSYILDALKKSEQARTDANTQKVFEELPELPAWHPRTSGSSRRWLYLIAFILVLTVSFLVFQVGPRRSSVPPPRTHLAGYRPAVAGIGHPGRRSHRPAGEARVGVGAGHPGLQSHHLAAKGRASATAEQPGSGALATRRSNRPAHTAITESTPLARENTRHVKSWIARKSHATGLSAKREFRKPQPVGPAIVAKISRATSPRPKAAGNLAGGPTASAPRRVEVAAKKTPLSVPSKSHQSRQTAVALKAAHLKALLEKQAERVEKASKPGSNREKFADIRGFSAPDSSNEPPVEKFSQLPPRIREALPDISVSMLVYSKQPANRFIYINGSKRHEGDEISPGLKVQRITPDGAIFAYRGLHFYKSVIGN